MKIKKATFRHVEAELASYSETRKEIDRLRNEIIYASSPPDTNGGGRSNIPGDPTGRTATMLLTHKTIVQMESIVNAISEIYTQLPEEKQKLIKLEYWTKPQILTWDGIAERLHVSKKQAQRWRDEIVLAIAEKIGWR